MRKKTIITKLLQSVTKVYYKVWQTVITKYVKYYQVWQGVITKCDSYYKVRRNITTKIRWHSFYLLNKNIQNVITQNLTCTERK